MMLRRDNSLQATRDARSSFPAGSGLTFFCPACLNSGR
jgi:hypothetical protein